TRALSYSGVSIGEQGKTVEAKRGLRFFSDAVNKILDLIDRLLRRLAGQRAPLHLHPALGCVGRDPDATLDERAMHGRRADKRVDPSPELQGIELLERRDDPPHPADRAPAQIPAAAVGRPTPRDDIDPNEALVGQDQLPFAALRENAPVGRVIPDEALGTLARVFL